MIVVEKTIMKILVPTPVKPEKKSLRTVYVNNVIKFLREKNPTKIAWFVYQPDKVKTVDIPDMEVYDIHDFDNAIDLLKKIKPDCVMVNNTTEIIQYSLSLAANFLKIPLVSFYYFDYQSEISASQGNFYSPFITLRKLLSDYVPTDTEIEKKFLRRGRFFTFKYSFLIKTKKSVQKANFSILQSMVSDFFSYLFEKKFTLNKLPNLHLLPDNSWIEPLTNLGIKKENLVVTGNPFWDNLYGKISQRKKPVHNSQKINLLIVTDSLVEHGIWSKSKRKSFLTKLLTHLQKNKDISFSFKIHPSSESKTFYETLLKELKIDAKIYQSEDFWDIISDFDLVVSYGATGIHTELSIVGIKMILVDLDFNFPQYPFLQEGIDSGHIRKCKHLNELVPMILQFTKEEIQHSEEFCKSRDSILFKFDGKAGQRVADVILNLAIKNS